LAPELPREAKIAYFQLLFIADEQIFRLDVPVDDIKRMHVGQGLEQLVHEQPNELGLQTIRGFFQYLKQVVLDVLEDQVNDSFFAESLFKFHSVGVTQHLEDFHLSHGGFLNDFVLLRLLKLFDGHDFLIFVGLAFEDHSVRSLPDHAHNIILLHLNFITITQHHPTLPNHHITASPKPQKPTKQAIPFFYSEVALQRTRKMELVTSKLYYQFY
jgi:hypothetical protein